MQVFLNGRMLPYDEAALAHDDAGLQHAVGLFETMYARHGRVFRLGPHLDRLIQSAESLGLAHIPDRAMLESAVSQTLAENDMREARVRLTVTPGRVSLLRPADQSQISNLKSSLLVVATPPTAYDPAYFENGIRVIVGPAIANPFDPLAGHKTLAYWSRLMQLRRAAEVQAGEAILLQTSNHLASGAISNVFLVRSGKLLTPIARGEEQPAAMPAPVLPGITRAAVIELAQAAGITVEKRMLAITDLLDADEIFLTNSGWQLLPVTSVEKKVIAGGKVGPVTRTLREKLLAMIESETTSSH